MASEDNSSLADLTYDSRATDRQLYKLSVLGMAVKAGRVELGPPFHAKQEYPALDVCVLKVHYADTVFYRDTIARTLAGTPVVVTAKSTAYRVHVVAVGEEWKLYTGSPE